MSRALWQTRYRELVGISGTVESARLRGLPRGLRWKLREGRIVLRGTADRRGRFDVRVALRGPDAKVSRTFRLRVR